MKKDNLKDVFRNIGTAVGKHSPEILTGIGIAGMISATVLAVKFTPKAVSLIEEEKKNKHRKLEPLEVVKTTWKCYIPTVVTTTLSIACLIGASSVNHKRNAALATAYSLSETALREYRDKVVETIGEKKEHGIREGIAKDKIEQNPVSKHDVIITGAGNTLCYDTVSGRYFYSDCDKIKKAENILNHKLITEMYISLNDFYYEIGLNPVTIGDDLGWNVDNGYMDFAFSSQLAENGTPCLVIDYLVAPRYDFKELY